MMRGGDMRRKWRCERRSTAFEMFRTAFEMFRFALWGCRRASSGWPGQSGGVVKHRVGSARGPDGFDQRQDRFVNRQADEAEMLS